MLVCQKPISTSGFRHIEWLEKVVCFSGLSCCIICQKVAEKAMVLASAGASQMLFVKNGIG